MQRERAEDNRPSGKVRSIIKKWNRGERGKGQGESVAEFRTKDKVTGEGSGREQAKEQVKRR